MYLLSYIVIPDLIVIGLVWDRNAPTAILFFLLARKLSKNQGLHFFLNKAANALIAQEKCVASCKNLLCQKECLRTGGDKALICHFAALKKG